MTNKNPFRLKKGAFLTDIHFGCKSNSSQHNQDCIDYLQWFCDHVRADPEIDHIQFLGDWHENRSALNISTLKYAFEGAQMLNNLGMPVFFTIGNHDLYHRHSREVHSVVHFSELENFKIVEEPTVFDYIGDGVMMCPYLFHEEYPMLLEYTHIPFWSGHFEFKGFIVTGQGREMPTGPDHTAFKGPEYIVSGHFHKRQAGDNVIYMGNPFPTNFGDAGDDARGMMVHDFNKNEMMFYDWEVCPKYRKCTLTQIADGEVELLPNMRVKCIADEPINFEQSTAIREQMIKNHSLREFTLEESMELREALSETESGINWDEQQLAGVDDLVLQMLDGIDVDSMDNTTLITIYNSLKTQ